MCQRLVQIGDDIVGVLQTHGHADHTVGDAGGLPHLTGDHGVGHGGGLLHQRLRVAQNIAVAAHVLGEAVDDHVRAQLQRPGVVGRGEGVVTNTLTP